MVIEDVNAGSVKYKDTTFSACILRVTAPSHCNCRLTHVPRRGAAVQHEIRYQCIRGSDMHVGHENSASGQFITYCPTALTCDRKLICHLQVEHLFNSRSTYDLANTFFFQARRIIETKWHVCHQWNILASYSNFCSDGHIMVFMCFFQLHLGLSCNFFGNNTVQNF